MLCLTLNHTSIPALFNSIYTKDIPVRFTFRFLQSLGFKSSKMRDLVTFLHAFGFLDAEGVPTSSYVEFKKATDPKAFVSACATSVYQDVLPTLDELSESNLKRLFLAKYPNLDAQKVNLAVKTFMAINLYAPFYKSEASSTPGASFVQKTPSRQNLNININLPETENERVYAAIFKYLKEILTQ